MVNLCNTLLYMYDTNVICKENSENFIIQRPRYKKNIQWKVDAFIEYGKDQIVMVPSVKRNLGGSTFIRLIQSKVKHTQKPNKEKTHKREKHDTREEVSIL